MRMRMRMGIPAPEEWLIRLRPTCVGSHETRLAKTTSLWSMTSQRGQ